MEGNTNFVLIGGNTLEVAFVMEVSREQNNHNFLYNRSLPNQHPIEAITGLRDELDENSSAIVAEKERAEGVEGSLDNLTTKDKDNLVSAINEVDLHADNNATNLSNHINDKSNPHEVTKAQVGLGDCDNTADINKPISTATQTALDNIANGTTSIAYDNTTSGLSATTLQGAIDEIDSDLDNVEDLIPSTASSSNQLADKDYVDTADNNLQSQIDAISASSDVTDIVGTYAELQAYDTSTLTNDDIIKVLQDESQGGATTYYRWVISGSSGSFVLIGAEGPYYTKAEADELLGEKQNKIDSTHKLDSDLVDDSGQTNKFVTASEKTQISTNASDITALQSGKADKSTTYTKTEVDTIASGKANVGLDNLNADGQMIIDSQNGTISNCILEIPQNLKLTLENNVLTLKSGSILTRTGSTYATVTTTNDISRDISNLNNGVYPIFINSSLAISAPVEIAKVGSGSTTPADGDNTYYRFFNSTDKYIYYNNGSSWDSFSIPYYPLCVINVIDGVASFAKDSNGRDMIFNGAGFIGHHAFVYPNVKGLWANGFNDDGSLKSSKLSLSSLLIIELTTGQDIVEFYSSSVLAVRNYIGEYDNVSDLPNLTSLYYTAYVKSENAMYYKNRTGDWSNQAGKYLNFIKYAWNGTTVTDFTIRQPVRLATTEMLDSLQSQVDTNTSDIANKQDTLVSGTNIKTINGTTVLGSGNFTLANQSLSNLDSTGQMVVDSQNGTISNCILEIPQNIKLTLENNTITLKSGSTVVLGSGSTYTTLTTTADISKAVSPNAATVVVWYKPNGTLDALNISGFSSGTTAPTSFIANAYGVWFNPDDKMIKFTSNGGDSWTSGQSYPLCVLKLSNGVFDFDKDSNGNDMIFNGAGFIGHHAFVYPNVKALNPDGIDTNGTLKSKEITISSLLIAEMQTNLKTVTILSATTVQRRSGYLEVKEYVNPALGPQYVIPKNIIILNNLIRNETPFIFFTYNGTTVTQFDIRQPYKGARDLLTDEIKEEVATKQVDVTTLTSYDATQTQTLKNINGVLQWVTD